MTFGVNNFYSFQIFQSHFSSFKNIYIIGYSYGAVIGLELAKLLEKEGKNIKFISIDGSLSLFKKYLHLSMRNQEMNYQNLEDWLLVHFSFEIRTKSMKELLDAKNSEEKLQKVQNIFGSKKYSRNYLKNIFCGMQNRLQSVIDSHHDQNCDKLKAEIVLIRPNIGFLSDISDDYDLKLSTENDVRVCYSDKRHLTLLEDENVQNIIKELCKTK